MFIPIETKAVPIDRVFTNLLKRLVQDTNNFEATYYLARVHSMAFSTNLTEVNVRSKETETVPVFNSPYSDAGVPQSVQSFASRKARETAALNHLTNAIALYERAILLLKRSTNLSQKSWMILPTQLGLAWCLDQAGRTNEAIQMYRKTLKVAWKQEVIGNFDLKEWANDVWSDVRAGKNPVRAHYQGHLGPGVCYSEEVIDYLLKLLDPVKDASEIAQLNKDKTTLTTVGRVVTPIFVPLAPANFEELVNEQAQVVFDLDGSGRPQKWGWVTPKAGWLVFDPSGTGRITSGLQMFGNVTFWIFWPDGYQALSSLDDNADGILSGQELCGLAVWRDANSNGVSEPGEVVPVEALGIQLLSCGSQADETGMRWNPCGVGFTNGVFRATYDWIVPAETRLPEP